MKITVCGSIAFYNQMEDVKKVLEAQGHEVLIPLLRNEVPEMGGDRKTYFGKYIEDNGGIDAFPVGHAMWDMKESAIRDHYEKIEWGDAILVANYEKRGLSGYVGGNTLIEMGLAFFLKKPIYLLNPVTSELSYKQEILGMKPILLNGDLSVMKS
jgi:diphthamide synthase subunit DPH2